MHRRLATLLALTLIPTAGQAQGIATIKPLYEMAKSWLVKSAEMLPEADYGFKPTPAVRSFGQLIGHVANANYMMCSTVKGEKNPAMQDFEKNTEKAALVKALKDALAYCDGVYTMADADLTGTAEMFGMKMTRMGWAFLNVTHDNEHYGNLVTYLRMKGLTPPSSQGPGM